MLTMRCPYGCYFEISQPEWAALSLHKQPLVCRSCHRSNPTTAYVWQQESKHAKTANAAVIPQKDRQAEIDNTIKERLAKVVNKSQNPMFRDDALFRDMVRMLMNAEMTINFPTPYIFGLIQAGEYQSMWQRGSSSTDKYGTERNAGERQIFARMNAAADTTIPDELARPKYIGLNLGNLRQGPAPTYGRSFFVLKDAVKLRSTFIATDSLQMIRGDATVGYSDVCSYATLPNIMLRVSDRQLAFMAALAGGPPASNPNEFIEVHGWGRIDLKTDVSELIVNEAELDEWPGKERSEPENFPTHLKGKSKADKQKAVADLKKELKAYCTANNIKLTYEKFDSASMNSTKSRKR